jgi:hypothetical protein
MKRRVENSALRRHRPKKRFRFEYIRGRFSGMTAEQRFWRAFDEMEKEQDGYLDLVEKFERYKRGEEEEGDVIHE